MGWVRRGWNVWGQHRECTSHISDCSPGPRAGVAQCGQSRAAPQDELQKKCPCQPCVATQHLYPEIMVSPRLSREQGLSE